LAVEKQLDALVANEHEVFGAEPEPVHQGGVLVEVMDDIFNGVVAERIRYCTHAAAAETTTVQPDAEAIRVVVSPNLFSARVMLDYAQSAYFAAPVDHAGIEQPELLQVEDQGCSFLVWLPAGSRQRVQDAAMV